MSCNMEVGNSQGQPSLLFLGTRMELLKLVEGAVFREGGGGRGSK